MILSCQHIAFNYVDENILKDVTFHINEKEKAAIVGINGAGKTTLFRILLNQLTPDSGDIYLKNDTKVGYLSQTNDYSSDKTVYDEMYLANSELLAKKAELSALEDELHASEVPSDELLHKHHDCLEAFQDMNGFAYENQVKAVLNGLNFNESEHSQIVNTLSGGQKTRLALGKLLLQAFDLLLLDEPTNHLDLHTITWLENFLNSNAKSLLIISHDRYFLDRLVTKIIEIEYGKATMYKGNYSDYITKKEFHKAVAEKHYDLQQKEIKRQEEIIADLRSRGNEIFIKRAQSREKALDKIDMLDKPIHLRSDMNLTLHPRKESGNDVLRVHDMEMAFDDKKLFSNLNFDIFKGEKIALIGANGVGKTTLFRILLHKLQPKSGSFKIGAAVETAYYDQEHATLDESLTLIEDVNRLFPDMNISEVRNLLGAFLFTNDDVFKLVGSLSGGEKGRLSLAKLMLSEGNFLLLDEPTNHLDMISKEVLENALRNYSGTVFFISHDRYFINRVADKVLDLQSDGGTMYLGNYDYYLMKRENITTDSSPTKKETTDNKKQWLQQKEEQTRLNRIKKAIEKIEKEIEDIELRMEEIDEELTKEEIYSNHEKSTLLLQEKNELEISLSQKMEEWEELQLA